MKRQFWFLVGSQCLYGDDVLITVDARAKEMVEYLNKSGKLPYEIIERRLGDLKKRGVALKDGFTLKDLYDERTPLYEKYADIVIDESNLTLEETLQKTLSRIKQ